MILYQKIQIEVSLKYKLSLIALILLFLSDLHSQEKQRNLIDRNRISGAKLNYVDTLARETTNQLMKESLGLLEKAINPDKYIVGPNDILTVSIVSSDVFEFSEKISPDGKFLIKGVGVVDLNSKTLTEARSIIIEKTAKTYRNASIDVMLKEIRQFKVIVSGEISKPVSVVATAADRVSEVIDRAGGLKYGSSERKIILWRKNTNTKFNVDLLKFFAIGIDEANPTVLDGDMILISTISEKEIIQISGEVYSPDSFEFIEGDSLSTLVKFSQGFLKSALLDSVEFVRQNLKGGLELRILDLRTWDKIMTKSENLVGDFALQSGDRLYVRKSSSWNPTEYAVILGEVKYPGKYAIDSKFEKIADIIKRAGGFTDIASPERGEFIRQIEMDKIDLELERLKLLPPSEMSVSEVRYYQAKSREKKGAMAINFYNAVHVDNSDDNISIMDKDSIIIPKKIDYVNIQGRVNNPGNVKFNPEFTYEDYIRLAGGYSYRADIDETFINKVKGGQYLAKSKDYKIEPGDVILVPTETEISAYEIFTTTLTVVTQLFTIAGIVLTIINIRN